MRLLASFLLFSLPLLADEPLAAPLVPSYQGAFIRMLLTLAGLLVAIFLAAWALKKLSQGKLLNLNPSKTRAIKILEQRALSPKTILYLVEINNQQVVLAESQLEIKKVASFDIFSEPEKEI